MQTFRILFLSLHSYNYSIAAIEYFMSKGMMKFDYHGNLLKIMRNLIN